MVRFTRRELIIIFFDLLISLFAFWFSRYFGDFPRWYYLVLSALLWVAISCVSGKLKFGDYKRIRYALAGIFTINIFTGVVLFFSYRYTIPEYRYDYSILLAVVIITLLEWILYYSVRKIVYRKIPFFYEEPTFEDFTLLGINGGATVSADIDNKDVKFLLDNTQKQKDFTTWIKENRDSFSNKTIIVETSNPEDILSYKTRNVSLIINTLPLNKIRHINTGLSYANYCLQEGGFISCHCITSGIRKEKIMKQCPIVIRDIIHFFDYLWHRVAPKISVFKYFYYWLTKGERRSLTRVEVLGRFYRAGFEVIEDSVMNGKFHILAVKVKAPIRDDKPSNGMLIRLRRVGKNGKIIGVYKFRTMHAYSEYLQPYIYKCNNLSKGGKIEDDYRVSPIGHFLRKTWFDELPMLINWLKGDLKLVGVRPLSQHYFGLYSPELQQLRVKTKPGLVPPFYADMPETLEEIEASEVRYLKVYLKNPMLTDWRYFWKAFRNIVLKGKRSK
ncbi:sugar transferase [Bacteroides sp.]|uniref:sugar transferase n=1 Tax=Bacteroides sp. TaxID=29523 RepID=UPI002606C185|nr:sugar transferase [Bacteroides sp.]MDD3038769.1 sugar transferase [Bacteroides sp.]